MSALVTFGQRAVQLDALPSHVRSCALHLPGDQQHRPRVACHASSVAQIALAVTTLDRKQRSTALTSKPASLMAWLKSLRR